MTLDLNNSDKLNGFRQELGRLGIRLLPPDINASFATFSVEHPAGGAPGAGGIRYALAGVKTVGEPAARALIEERRQGGPYRSLVDFARRLDPHHLNKRQLENLARAGAFASLEPNRRKVFAGAEAILRCAGASATEREGDQIGLFAASGLQEPPRLQLDEVADWPAMEQLSEELEAVGFYLSAHPLDAYAARLKRLKAVRFAELAASGRSGPAILAGTVIARKERTSGKGNKYAFVSLSDASSVYEVTVFSEVLAAVRDKLGAGCSLVLHVTAQIDGDAVRCTAQRIEPLEQAMERLADGLDIFIDAPAPLPPIRAALAEAPAGRGQIRLVAGLDPGREVELTLPVACRITAPLVARLRAIQGVRDVREA